MDTSEYKPLYIAQVVQGFPPTDCAGVPQHVCRLQRILAKNGNKCVVISGGSQQDHKIASCDGDVRRSGLLLPQWAKRLVPSWSRRIELASYGRFCQRQVLECDREACSQKEVLIVHGHTWLFGGKQALRSAHNVGVPVVITLHGAQLQDPNEQFPPPYFAELQSASAVIVQKTSALRKMIAWGYPSERTYMCVGPVNIPPESEIRTAARAKDVCFVGRLSNLKRPSLLLKALPLILQDLPDTRAHFLGDGPLLQTLRREAAALGVADRTKFYGWVDDVTAVLKTCDAFVALSPFHNSSDLSLLEAMAHGLAVIVTASLGIEDLIDHNRNGLICDGHPKALAQAVLRCLPDYQLRCQLGRSARKTAIEKASFDNVMKKHLTIYRSVIVTANKSRDSDSE